MSLYVGIDQALRKIGLCVLENGTATVLEYIATPKDLTGPERLVFLKNALLHHLLPYRKNIKAAAYEGQALRALGDLDQLGNIGGVIAVLLNDDLGVTAKHIYKVPPATLKKFVTGHANASKSEMMTTSSALWAYNFTQDDVCDAHGLARVAEECVEQTATQRHQIEAVYSLLYKKRKVAPIKKLFPKSL